MNANATTSRPETQQVQHERKPVLPSLCTVLIARASLFRSMPPKSIVAESNRAMGWFPRPFPNMPLRRMVRPRLRGAVDIASARSYTSSSSLAISKARSAQPFRVLASSVVSAMRSLSSCDADIFPALNAAKSSTVEGGGSGSAGEGAALMSSDLPRSASWKGLCMPPTVGSIFAVAVASTLNLEALSSDLGPLPSLRLARSGRPLVVWERRSGSEGDRLP